MTEPEKCGAKLRGKRAGELCQTKPMRGQRRCRQHGAKNPAAILAGERRAAEAEARKTMEAAVTTLGLPRDIDPAKALLDEIARTYGAVLWLEGKVRELEPEDLAWGETQHEHGIGPEGPIDKHTEKAEFNAWYRLYTEERDRLTRVSAIALKSGIEERRVRLAESQGDLVYTAIRSILDGLQLTAEQSELIPIIVPQALRALEAGD